MSEVAQTFCLIKLSFVQTKARKMSFSSVSDVEPEVMFSPVRMEVMFPHEECAHSTLVRSNGWTTGLLVQSDVECFAQRK